MHIIDVINSLQLGQPDFGFFGAFFVESRPVGMFAALDSPPLFVDHSLPEQREYIADCSCVSQSPKGG